MRVQKWAPQTNCPRTRLLNVLSIETFIYSMGSDLFTLMHSVSCLNALKWRYWCLFYLDEGLNEQNLYLIGLRLLNVHTIYRIKGYTLLANISLYIECRICLTGGNMFIGRVYRHIYVRRSLVHWVCLYIFKGRYAPRAWKAYAPENSIPSYIKKKEYCFRGKDTPIY